MSLEIRCSVQSCRKILNAPGAVVLSPPWETEHDVLCHKYHLCASCWVGLWQKIIDPDVGKLVSD